MSIVENIKSLCLESGSTIPKLEQELGFGRGSIYNWDKNSPSISKVRQVSEYFRVSLDRVLYGFELSQLEALVNFIRDKRSYEQFAADTGVDLEVLENLGIGLSTERPSIEVIKQISLSNPVKIIVDEESLFKAAGYTKEDIQDIDLTFSKKFNSISDKFRKAGFTIREGNQDEYPIVFVDKHLEGTVAHVHLPYFISKGDLLLKELTEKYGESNSQEPETIAAHHDGEEWTEEELEEIERFKEFVRMKRSQPGKE